MTAIKKFSRLEAKAVWKENDNKPAKSVIVSFGKSSIIISTENAFPLDHWSFNTIVMISKSKENTIFSQDSNKNEKLIIEDIEMINAIILICNLKTQTNRSIFRFRKFFKFLFFSLFLLIFFYFPIFVREIIFEATDPKNEIIYYDNALNKFLSANKICNKNLSIKNFEKKFNQFFITENFIELIIVKYGEKKPLFLPGGKIIIPFSWLKTEKSYSNFKKMLQVAIHAYEDRYIFKHFIKDQSFKTILSFIFRLNDTFDLNLSDYQWSNFIEKNLTDLNLFVTDDEWINFKNICYN